jgi:hypothetical protein
LTNNTNDFLIAIYDKSEKASLPDKELKEILKGLPEDELEGENAT